MMSVSEDVRLDGHIIDSLVLPRVLDDILSLDGEYHILDITVGHEREDVSTAILRVEGRDRQHLDALLERIQAHGATAVYPEDVRFEPAPADAVFPSDFYSTTNLQTFVRLDGSWVEVTDPEMDCAIVLDPSTRGARTVPLIQVRAGERVVVGREGIRVVPLARPRKGASFEFMSSAVSSEKPKALVLHEVERLARETRAAGKTIVAVVGPAVVHTGAAPALARLIRAGWIDVVFGGNAIAVHDIEAALYGTSLGVDLKEGTSVRAGHEHHLRAINTIRACGGIRQAVERGVLTTGIFWEVVDAGIPYVLAGSIRDDGPLPDTITDVMEAQQRMREQVRGAGLCLMLSTMLHSIATGNLLPAAVHTVCVDINPAVVTKLTDRGSIQTIGIVTDVGLFLDELAVELGAD
jgi:lysine-ketoglutarate reductase/saccharopine dehydrogenase-like protein (TIGR00300 family)